MRRPEGKKHLRPTVGNLNMLEALASLLVRTEQALAFLHRRQTLKVADGRD